jgi:uroporphyrinogen-III decarboxylase
LLFGSDLFLAIMEEPDLVHDALEVVTETYLLFMRAWAEVAPFQPDYNAHWGLLHRGNIVLRDDSAMNLSPDQCREYAHPYDQRLLSELGGGVIHFCGRGDHFIDGMAQLAGVTAFNLSQPEYNDMELIYTATVDRGLPLLGLSRAEAERAAGAGRDLRGLAHCA